ncbi:uncharacterized protein FTOL_10632 [Fusarium torulosum]|uniref:Pectate lyase superfamily protein domain-containing protein n=1 Tax=Fusarium torulosum TaxID=33205 RepID=A0AAE8SMH6_9HYPO|nr:uncharacterized protein FTOL_10632 [Fusarium torulosum]
MTFTFIALLWFTIQVAQTSQLAIRDPEIDWASIVSSHGDHFPDFSYSGYNNSDTSLPTINHHDIVLSLPRKVTDDIAPAIQEAIDTVWENGGGVVRLPPGKLYITAGMQLRSSVVVTGTGDRGTTLILKRRPSKAVFTLGRLGVAPKADFGFRSKIADAYVPIGASTVTVINGTGFAVGQHIYVSRAVTESWIRANGMSDLVRNGDPQQWIPVGKQIMAPNTIKAINGNKITLKIPLADNLDLAYMRAEVRAYTPPELTSEMGIENLRIEVRDTCSGTPLDNTTCNYAAVKFASWTVDSWASGLTLTGFNKFFEIQRDASRITIQDSTMDRNKDIDGSALPSDIMIRGSQVLIQDCDQVGLDSARSFSVLTDSLTPGPNTVTRYTTESSVQTLEPHERWSWGLLVEESSAITKFKNRGNMGTGHGWTMNAGVGWNLPNDVDFSSPPLGVNWCVGCGRQNEPRGNATFIQSGHQVRPRSLFAAQLKARGVQWYHRREDKNGSDQ